MPILSHFFHVFLKKDVLLRGVFFFLVFLAITFRNKQICHISFPVLSWNYWNVFLCKNLWISQISEIGEAKRIDFNKNC